MKTGRIASIDIFRAITMLLMIFVNDFWTLHDIPSWLEHAAADEDRLGFSDIIFPAFLFIVGLSIPFALDIRKKKGQPQGMVLIHIFQRSAALIIMGFYMVNLENFHAGLPAYQKAAWEVIMVFAIFLIWNNYRVTGGRLKNIPVVYFQIAGFLLLLLLAITYKGGTEADPRWMRPYWWGILGLIGWAYLLGAIVYFLAGTRTWFIMATWLILLGLNVLEFKGQSWNLPSVRLVVSASNHFLVMSGILASVLYKRIAGQYGAKKFVFLMVGLSIICLVLGFISRPEWGISKIRATPSWTAICAGISYIIYALLYLIADIWGKTKWSGFIMPAGRSTLTCYLLPYFIYPTLGPLILLIPYSLTGGVPGLIKSFLFALIVVWLTGLLEKINVRLKI